MSARRSLHGYQSQAREFNVHESRLRQGVDLWDFIYRAVHAFIANTTQPSLVPRALTPLAAPSSGTSASGRLPLL